MVVWWAAGPPTTARSIPRLPAGVRVVLEGTAVVVAPVNDIERTLVTSTPREDADLRVLCDGDSVTACALVRIPGPGGPLGGREVRMLLK